MIQKYTLRILPGIIILSILFYYLGVDNILSTLSQFHNYWFIPAALSVIFSTLLGSYNLYILINHNTPLSYNLFLRYYWLSWAMGLVVPGQIGDVLSLSYWLHRQGFSWKSISGLTIIDKLITLFWMVAFALLGVVFLSSQIPYQSQYGESFSKGLVILLISFFLFVFLFRKKLIRAFYYNISKISSVIYHSRKIILLNFIMTPAKILLTSAAYLSLFNAAGISVFSLGTISILVSLSSLISYIPISFNGIGTVELTGIAVFGSFGVDSSVILSVFLSLRLLVIALAWLPGIFLFYHPPKTAN